MKELVTIDHDGRAIYLLGTPYAKKTLLPHVKRVDRFHYLIGEMEPNYPVPAIPLAVDINPDEITLWSDREDIGDLIQWRKALVTWSIYGPPIYL